MGQPIRSSRGRPTGDFVTAAALLFAAGLAAGLVNTVAGAGTLCVYPVLLLLGYSPVTSNITAAVGVLPGSISGAVGGRRDLRLSWRDSWSSLIAVCAGSITGSTCLLVLDPQIFTTLAPWLIVLASILVVGEPLIRRHIGTSQPAQTRNWLLIGLLFAGGFYGGYFGAAQGIVLIAVLSFALPWTLTRLNAVKNALGAASNGVAVLVFATLSQAVAWRPAALVAAGAVVGGLLGARLARRLPALALRVVILVLGLLAASVLLRG